MPILTRTTRYELKTDIATKIPTIENLLRKSQEFDSAVWTKSNTTADPDTADTTDPLGTNLAEKITNTSGGGSGITVSQNGTVPSATTCAASVYAKAGAGTTWFCVAGGSGGGNSISAYFNLATGLPGTFTSFGAGWTYVNHYMVAVGSGWYRCTAVLTPPGTLFGVTFRECTSDGANASTLSSVYYLFGAQLEVGSNSGPYTATS